MYKNLSKFNDSNHIHFITTKTYENKCYFKNEKCCLILLEELNFYRQKLGFKILGYVIMPDHLHCLIFWEVDKNPKLTISKIVQSFKSHCAKEILYYLETGRRNLSFSPYSTSASEGSHLPVKTNENSRLPNDARLSVFDDNASEGSHLPDNNDLSSQTGSWKPSPSGSWKPSLPDHYKWENTGKVHTKSKTKFWQKGFYDFNIYTEKKLKEKFDYMHNNPVKAGLCAKAEDYKWSSYCQIMGIEKQPVLRVDVL